MTHRAKMRRSSTYGKEPTLEQKAEAAAWRHAGFTDDPPKTGFSDAEDLALNWRIASGRITDLEAELARAKRQADATRNYRLQAIATPIMASLVERADLSSTTDEARSLARLALIFANALLSELERTETE